MVELKKCAHAFMAKLSWKQRFYWTVDFTKYFLGESKFRVFPHYVLKSLKVISRKIFVMSNFHTLSRIKSYCTLISRKIPKTSFFSWVSRSFSPRHFVPILAFFFDVLVWCDFLEHPKSLSASWADRSLSMATFQPSFVNDFWFNGKNVKYEKLFHNFFAAELFIRLLI